MEKSFEFFSLDEDLKEKLRKGPEYQGWVAQGREIFDQDEEGEIAELEVRETFDLKNISPGVRQDQGFLARKHRGMLSQDMQGEVGNATTLRSIHYPPIPDSLAALYFIVIPGIVRCGEHSDYGT